MTKKLYIIHYNDCYGSGDTPHPTYEGTTELEPKEWLKLHNKDRENEGNEPEYIEEFNFEEVEDEDD